MLARLQRGYGLRHMALHGRGYDHRVYVGLQHIVEHAVRVWYAVLAALLGEQIRIEVAQRGYLHALHRLKAHQG